ncbi:MAG: hypothetical protein IPL78_20635 [Chloroflexi bacterium]|nr:hypothetical protein [Chloroflexota bacterium]
MGWIGLKVATLRCSIDGVAAPTAITTQNLGSQISQPTYLTILVYCCWSC